MRVRFPFLLKKRGQRRSGSRLFAQSGEVLYNLVFIAAGAIGAWYDLSAVLIPDWRLHRESSGFVETTCQVQQSRVLDRQGLAGEEYRPELKISFTTDAGEAISAWTSNGVGRNALGQDEAYLALRQFRIGEERPAWYDPRNPERVVLARSTQLAVAGAADSAVATCGRDHGAAPRLPAHASITRTAGLSFAAAACDRRRNGLAPRCATVGGSGDR